MEGILASTDATRVEDAQGEKHRASVASWFDAHADFVWRTLQRFGASPSDAEDLLQEVFVIVLKHEQDIEDIQRARSWLYQIARRVVANTRRTRRRRERREVTVAQAHAEKQVVVDDVQPDEIIAAVERARMFERALQRLDEQRRELFVLYYVEGMSATALGELFSLSPNTVHSRLRLTRARLRRHLTAMGGFDGT